MNMSEIVAELVGQRNRIDAAITALENKKATRNGHHKGWSAASRRKQSQSMKKAWAAKRQLNQSRSRRASQD
jgi:hypothetical protein